MAGLKPIALAAAFALAATPVPALAQAAKAPEAPKLTNKEQAQEAFFYFRVLVSAIQSDKVEAPVKDALLGCIYANSLGKITTAVDKAIAANPGKVDKTKPNQVLGVMAGICGYRPAAAPAAAPTPAPKK